MNTPSCQDVKNNALQLQKHVYSWVVKIETPQRQYSPLYTPLAIILTKALCRYDSLYRGVLWSS